MRKIKIHISNYSPLDPSSYGTFLLSILKKYYEVEMVDSNPEYLFFNEGIRTHVNFDCIKIFYTGENVHPNFNLTDYAIGCDYMEFGDRYYRFPVYMVAQFYNDKELALAGDPDFTKKPTFTADDLAKKTDFCSFVYSNYLGGNAREEMFNKLSKYKKVNAGGNYLNNVGGRVPNKLEFEMKHKFSIAFENSSSLGYTTEKLPNALVARTIPIYWGNPQIGKEFNTKRFINCHEFDSFDQVVERVKKIDNDDELYLKIINEPIEAEYDFNEARVGFENFLRHIIDQPLSKAKRININPVKVNEIKQAEKLVHAYTQKKNARKRALAKIYKPFKKLRFIEELKQKFLRKKMLK